MSPIDITVVVTPQTNIDVNVIKGIDVVVDV
jgi:hypothetical protein